MNVGASMRMRTCSRTSAGCERATLNVCSNGKMQTTSTYFRSLRAHTATCITYNLCESIILVHENMIIELCMSEHERTRTRTHQSHEPTCAHSDKRNCAVPAVAIRQMRNRHRRHRRRQRHHSKHVEHHSANVCVRVCVCVVETANITAHPSLSNNCSESTSLMLRHVFPEYLRQLVCSSSCVDALCVRNWIVHAIAIVLALYGLANRTPVDKHTFARSHTCSIYSTCHNNVCV